MRAIVLGVLLALAGGCGGRGGLAWTEDGGLDAHDGQRADAGADRWTADAVDADDAAPLQDDAGNDSKSEDATAPQDDAQDDAATCSHLHGACETHANCCAGGLLRCYDGSCVEVCPPSGTCNEAGHVCVEDGENVLVCV